MAAYVNTINGNKIFADRAENTKKGLNIDDELDALKQAISAAGAFEVVSLNAQGKPDVASPSNKVIYLTKESSSAKTDPYTEWIYVGSSWEIIGETSIDLSGYKTKQTAKSDPTASGNDISFIDTITQDTNGEIKATKKTVRSASTSQPGLMSSADKTKLDNIASGAEVNVQSDWDVTDTAADAYIKNKPSIPVIGTIEI